MTTTPTGHFAQRDDGLYLQFDRLFTAPIGDVWRSLTSPVELAKWIGTYTGDPRTGAVRFKMLFEESADWYYTSILVCNDPTSLHVDIGKDENKMRLFAHLRVANGLTALTFGQRIDNPADAAQMGPGWDYYLDRLKAARTGHAMPIFESYYPLHSAHYASLLVPAK